MAQTFRAFGSEVAVLHADAHVLPREEADAAAVVERRLAADGVRLVHRAHLTRVERADGEVVVHYESAGGAGSLRADRLLVGIGRTPNLEGLGLEAAGIEYDRQGVRVDDHLRTTNPRVYAAGDVASRFKFTHTADAAARIVLTNALFLGRRKASALTVPWCTYTTPEVAHVGLYEEEAAERGIEVQRFTIPFAEVDRALLDGEEEGFLRVLTQKGSERIVGATLVAAHAGDMISELTLAMVGKIGLGALANVIHPYPTQAEAIRKAGDAYNRTRLTPLVKRLFRAWLRVRR
jgi:pyruvate/2-oxoglutarate dehydrogenase complex dihydrolipoamide dehydrogenase (E3) component